MSLVLSMCQYVWRPRRCLGQASWGSKCLDAPRLQALESSNQLSVHGTSFINITTTKTRATFSRQAGIRACFGFVFGIWNWYYVWRKWSLPYMGFAWKGEKLPDDSSSWLRIICSPQVFDKTEIYILHLQIRWCLQRTLPTKETIK